jgi:SAM-dependent methyltransferase
MLDEKAGDAMDAAVPDTEHGPTYDRARLRGMLANEADMSFKRRAEAMFDFLAIEPGDRVLDAGCGRGFYLNFLRALYPEVFTVGVELDLPLLPVALAHVPGARVANANLYALPFPDGFFNKIICSEVMEHVTDDQRAMRELARVLAPGGTLGLSVPNADYPLLWDPINKVLEAAFGTHIQTGPLAGIWANHVRLYSPESLSSVVNAAGLDVAEVRCYTHYCFPFIHNLVYGVGKELLERGLLPGDMAAAADRYRTDTGGSLLNPVRLGLALFNAVDRLNDWDPPTPDRSFLNIALRARKPERAA